MHDSSLPRLGARYWTAISVASVFGAALGDFISHPMHLGHWRGLLPLACLFGLILLAERTTKIGTETFYWLAVVVVRAAATNVADLATHDLHLGNFVSIAGLGALLLLSGATSTSTSTSTSPRTRPDSGAAYWPTLFLAGTLGTVLGDDASDRYGLRLATILLGGVLALLFLLRRADAGHGKLSYWLTMVGARSAGTSAGDLLADRTGFGFGIPATAAGSALLLLAVLLLSRTPKAFPVPSTPR